MEVVLRKVPHHRITVVVKKYETRLLMSTAVEDPIISTTSPAPVGY